MADSTPTTRKQPTEQAGAESTRGGVYFSPRVDIFETDQELVLCADMPGVRPADIDLNYEKGELTIHGRLQSRQHPGHPVLTEYDEGDFYRLFRVGESIDSSRIRAECKNGVLTVHLPKVKAAQPRQIKVQGG
jgi:HSP20 family protein